MTSIKVGQPALVELPGQPWSVVRAAVSDFRAQQVVLLVEEGVAIAPAMRESGRVVDLSLTDRAGIHRAQATVAGCVGRKLTVLPQGAFRTEQRRQYFRLVFNHPVRVQVLTSSSPQLRGTSDEATAEDLSGNGIRIKTRLPLLCGDWVSVQFSLDADRFSPPLRLSGLVRRRVQDTDSLQTIGVQFQQLSAREEDRLVSYLLKQQAKLNEH